MRYLYVAAFAAVFGMASESMAECGPGGCGDGGATAAHGGPAADGGCGCGSGNIVDGGYRGCGVGRCGVGRCGGCRWGGHIASHFGQNPCDYASRLWADFTPTDVVYRPGHGQGYGCGRLSRLHGGCGVGCGACGWNGFGGDCGGDCNLIGNVASRLRGVLCGCGMVGCRGGCSVVEPCCGDCTDGGCTSVSAGGCTSVGCGFSGGSVGGCGLLHHGVIACGDGCSDGCGCRLGSIGAGLGCGFGHGCSRYRLGLLARMAESHRSWLSNCWMSCGGALDPCGLVQGYGFPATPCDLSFSGHNSGCSGCSGQSAAVMQGGSSNAVVTHQATGSQPVVVEPIHDSYQATPVHDVTVPRTQDVDAQPNSDGADQDLEKINI